VNNKFPKKERLCSRRQINELFQKGSTNTKTVMVYPFRVVYSPGANYTANTMLVSVPKRNFKKAVERNRIKRQVKEAYRLNKTLLPANAHLNMAFLYTARELPNYENIVQKLREICSKISRNHNS
jgi:ribonuclease P protein component